MDFIPSSCQYPSESSGVPSPQAQEMGHTVGGEQWASEQSFICIYSHSPSLVLAPELCLLSDQQGIIDIMHLNHPKTSPCTPLSAHPSPSLPFLLPCPLVETLSSRKPVPRARKVGGPVILQVPDEQEFNLLLLAWITFCVLQCSLKTWT